MSKQMYRFDESTGKMLSFKPDSLKQAAYHLMSLSGLNLLYYTDGNGNGVTFRTAHEGEKFTINRNETDLDGIIDFLESSLYQTDFPGSLCVIWPYEPDHFHLFHDKDSIFHYMEDKEHYFVFNRKNVYFACSEMTICNQWGNIYGQSEFIDKIKAE